MVGKPVRTRWVSRKRTAFDSSTLFCGSFTSGEVLGLSSQAGGIVTRTSYGPVDYWLGWRPLKAQDGDRNPAGSRYAPGNWMQATLRTRPMEIRILSGAQTPVSRGRRAALITLSTRFRIPPPVRKAKSGGPGDGPLNRSCRKACSSSEPLSSMDEWPNGKAPDCNFGETGSDSRFVLKRTRDLAAEFRSSKPAYGCSTHPACSQKKAVRICWFLRRD